MESDIENPTENETDAEPATESTMEALLQDQATFVERLKAREVVWVKVVQIQDKSVLVDIGEKQEGTIPEAEFGTRSTPAAGSRIPAVLVHFGRDNKPAVLSYKKARQELGWKQAEKAFQDKARVRGTVLSSVKGGFMVDVGGVSAFLPASLADLRPVRKPQVMIGTGVRCYILELHAEKKQLVVSRKAVLEEEVKKRKDKLLSALKPGEVRIGRVTHVAAGTGAFVDLGGLEALLATPDVAWKDAEKALAAMTPGQKLRVKVLRIDAGAGKVAVGARQLTPNPADALRRKYPPKATVKGKISELKQPDGVKLQLSDGGLAFCSAAELPQKENPNAKPGEREQERDFRGRDRERGRPAKQEPANPIWPAVGDAVTAVVLGIKPDTFEISVSIRRFEDMQDRKRVAQYMKVAPKLTLGQLLSPEDE